MLSDGSDVEIVGECDNGHAAVEAIQQQMPDLVLLDIQMPELDGFGVIRQVGVDAMPLVVFTTAYDDYAIGAFRVHALDYLLKPIDRSHLLDALSRAAEHVRGGRAPIAAQLSALLRDVGTRSSAAERIAIKVDGRVLFLRCDQIDWVEAVDDYVRLHVARQQYVVRETMAHLESRLPDDRFMRVHRSTLVNVDRVREVQPWFQGNFVLILADGTRLTSSRSYRERLQRFLADAL
jgi:two-component system LytT family response regulator